MVLPLFVVFMWVTIHVLEKKPVSRSSNVKTLQHYDPERHDRNIGIPSEPSTSAFHSRDPCMMWPHLVLLYIHRLVQKPNMSRTCFRS